MVSLVLSGGRDEWGRVGCFILSSLLGCLVALASPMLAIDGRSCNGNGRPGSSYPVKFVGRRSTSKCLKIFVLIEMSVFWQESSRINSHEFFKIGDYLVMLSWCAAFYSEVSDRVPILPLSVSDGDEVVDKAFSPIDYRDERGGAC
jgi:hypothetical protein